MIVRSAKKSSGSAVSSRLAMTPMIDIVFQLLIFFLLTFKVVPQEGDLFIAAAEEPGQATTEVKPAPIPLRLKLSSNDKGELTGIELNKKAFKDLKAVQKHLIKYFGDDRGPDSLQAKTTLEIVADPRLLHKHMIKAIDSVSGYKVEGKLIKLAAKLTMKTSEK